MASRLFLRLATVNKALTTKDIESEFHVQGFLDAITSLVRSRDTTVNRSGSDTQSTTYDTTQYLKHRNQNKNKINVEALSSGTGYAYSEEDDPELIKAADEFVKDYIAHDLEATEEVNHLTKTKKKKHNFIRGLLRISLRFGKIGIRVILYAARRIIALVTEYAARAIWIITKTFWRFIARPLLMALVDVLTSPVGLTIAGVALVAGLGYLAYKHYKGEGKGEGGTSTHPGPSGTSTESVKTKGYTTKGESLDVKDAIAKVSQQTGVSATNLTAIAAVESGLDPTRNNPNSSAGGLFQFLTKTWSGVKRNYGKEYGIPADASKYDPYYSALGEAAFIQKEIIPTVHKFKPNVNVTDVYLGHVLGTPELTKFMSHLKSNPNESAASVTPVGASGNHSYFYDSKGKARSLQQVYDFLSGYLREHTDTSAIPSRADAKTASVRKAIKDSNVSKSEKSKIPIVPKPKAEPVNGYFRHQNLIVSY